MNDYQYLTTCGCSQPRENQAVPRDAERTLAEDRVLLKCGTPGTVTIPADTEAGTSFNLANLNVDAGRYKRPCIRLAFQSNILTSPATVTLNFQVFKQCKGQYTPTPVGPIWTFSRVASTIDEANAFQFAVCDCDTCDHGCCNYSVVAVTAGTVPTVGTTILNNASLTAMVVETADC